MNPECQSLLALFACCFPQAHITLITSQHQYLFNLFMADERVTHSITFSRASLPSVNQVADLLEVSGLVQLIGLSPIALRLAIIGETEGLSFIKGSAS